MYNAKRLHRNLCLYELYVWLCFMFVLQYIIQLLGQIAVAGKTICI